MLKTSSGQTALAGLEKKLAGSVPGDSDIPGSVRRAVRLMLCGGAVTAVLGLFLVIATVADKNVLTDSTGKRLSGSELTGGVVYEIVVYLLLVTVWVLMARMNRAGRGFARWIASALAAISTLDTFRTVNSLKGGQTLTVIDIVVIAGTVITWVIGVLAVAMLWRSESSEYFRARAAAR
jgi:molybdopterin-binding protein